MNEDIKSKITELVRRPSIYARVINGSTINIAERPPGCFAAAEVYGDQALKLSEREVFQFLNGCVSKGELEVVSSGGWILYRIKNVAKKT